MDAEPKGAEETAPLPFPGTWYLAACDFRSKSRMPGQERREVLRHADRPHAGPAAAVRDGEGLVQVEVADVGADVAGRGQADLGVHVGAVHVHLAAVPVDDGADVLDAASNTPWVEG